MSRSTLSNTASARFETGFRESYVEHLLGPDSMVVGNK